MMAEPRHEEAPRPVPMGRARFMFTHGPQAGQTVGLTDHSLILGASEAADVVLDNPDGTIGSGHVRVWRREDEYILHQLDSFSTTYVNGERLDLRLAILERGDEIRIGPHTLIFDEVPVAEADAEAAKV
jgi:predicted component of type VI protein secretion system